MRNKLHTFLLFFFGLFFFIQAAQATHNRAGEITIDTLGDCTELRIRATIVTYTKASSVAADRDSLRICWGDGECEMVARSNGGGFGEILENDTKLNLYIITHKYPGRARYRISMTDPNRNGGILNVDFPNSETVPFHLETVYEFLDCLFDGPNNTPDLAQPPIDIGCLGQPFIHNPNPIDFDGDSLSFKLIVPLQALNTPVPNYLWPDQVMPGGNNNYNLNQTTGVFTWNSPQKEGEYNIAMYVISWRDGEAIDTMVRDMQILILDCEDNRPPEVITEDFFCVVAGETLAFNVFASDPDAGQQIKLTALGGPLVIEPSPASFSAPSGYQDPPVSGQFVWNTTCEHISDQPYTVVFRAIDDYFDDFGLATLKTVQIKVVGPSPEDVQANPRSNEIEVNWELPYFCEDTEEDYFLGFSVWRREGSNPFQIDTCTPGLGGQGYTRIIGNTNEILDGRYSHTDTNVERGKTYCYRVLANFARLTSFGQPYNLVESLASNEICVQLSRDVPLMVNVDVETTDLSNGEIFVRWIKPLAEDLDTLLNAGPYTYEVLRATGQVDEGFQPIGVSFTTQEFWQANDTSFTDTGLNTLENAYSYQIAFYVNGENEPLGNSNTASSVYLSIASTDETNNLSWEANVPWDNYEFVVYRERQDGSEFIPIATVSEPFYSDQGLVNGREYCYLIEAFGSYGVEGIDSPLINFSQEACGIPLDTIPPCPPELTVSNICDKSVNCIEAELKNDLRWINPMNLCEETDDVVTYNIYYAPFEGEDYSLIETITFSGDTTYEHRPDFGIAGCYAVTAIDTFFNESAFSNEWCIDNCPIYELPNTFTPNGDGQNDLFIPYPYCFVEQVDFKVFNRWGELVFQTQDPDLNWDGKNLRGTDLPTGTYYYSCQVFEQRVIGIVPGPEILKGFIELIRDN